MDRIAQVHATLLASQTMFPYLVFLTTLILVPLTTDRFGAQFQLVSLFQQLHPVFSQHLLHSGCQDEPTSLFTPHPIHQDILFFLFQVCQQASILRP